MLYSSQNDHHFNILQNSVVQIHDYKQALNRMADVNITMKHRTSISILKLKIP